MITNKLKEIECETVEYKKTTGELKEGIISIASILNKHNKGSLYFGIKNDGTIIGQQVSDKTLREISQEVANFIEPKIFPTITDQIINDKHIILVEFTGVDTPYSAYGEYRIRVADEDKKVTTKELEKLFHKKSTNNWDKEISESSIEDIDEDILKPFHIKGVETKRIKFEWKDIRDTTNRLNLLKENNILNAGHIAFSKKAKLPVKMGVFATDTKNTINDMNYIKTNLYEALNTCELYFRNNTKWKVEFPNGSKLGLKREEIPEIPFNAYREALLNSFIHRDMLSPIANEVCIFKDRIEIYNPGEFNSEYKIEDYLKGGGRSICRNQLLADTIYLSEDIEAFGTGLKRINDLCKEANIKVDFIKEKTGFVVRFWRKDVELEYIRKFDINIFSEQEKQIILYLEKNQTIARKQVDKLLKINARTSQRILSKLVEKSIIESSGGSKNIIFKLK
ncbi:MAG: ATP-binding protein [Clostridia bacterium]